MNAPVDLATALFGPEVEELPGRWVCEACKLRQAAGPCGHDPALRRWFLAATRPAGGGS